MEINKERLKEIIAIAYELKWVIPKDDFLSYPTMQMSEVEKCMIAMIDDSYLKEMRSWVNDIVKQKVGSVE